MQSFSCGTRRTETADFSNDFSEHCLFIGVSRTVSCGVGCAGLEDVGVGDHFAIFWFVFILVGFARKSEMVVGSRTLRRSGTNIKKNC